MPGRLIQRRGGRVEASYALASDVTTLGRGAENTVVLGGPFVSLRHAEVSWDGMQHVLRDMSKNGTFLNGSRVAAPQPLHDGDVITLPGVPDLTLTFDLAQITATWAPDAAAPRELRVDLGAAEVWVRGARVHVRRKEYIALALLWRKRGELVGKEELAAEVWPEHGGEVADDDIAQVVSGLRRKIEETPENPRLLVTVRGLGYRLVLSARDDSAG